MARDSSLYLQSFLPASGQTNFTGVLDLGVSVAPFSDQWRQGRLQVDFPALPNAINNAANITLTLQDSDDGGATFADVVPLTRVVMAGVSPNGIPSYLPGGTNRPIDMPLRPGLRGPIRIAQSVDANIGGDCSAGLVEYFWLNE
jgi:hypothetical protein